MSKNQPTAFVIIDDDPISNLLCRISIKSFLRDAAITTFNFPKEGFLHCSRQHTQTTGGLPTIIFLDINMPVWSGWDFLDAFEKLEGSIKNQFKVYIMSSSIDANDINRAAAHEYVIDYITKPVSKNCLEAIVNSYR